jgi:redox-sensitive bicupin YhaK (pirin superfamily)
LTLHGASRGEPELDLPLDPDFEHALVTFDGAVNLEGKALAPDALHYLPPRRRALSLKSSGQARALLIGGAPFGESILMWWNFVARTPEEIRRARQDWQDHRFKEVPTYRGPRTEAPELVFKPVVR